MIRRTPSRSNGKTRSIVRAKLAALALLLASGCSTPTVRGQGDEPSGGAGSQPGGASGGFVIPGAPPAGVAPPPMPACGALVATIRDFKTSHPDFEKDNLNSGLVRGLVQVDLDPDRKPVHAAAGPTEATTGPANFDQWYRDVADVNMRFEVPLMLREERPGAFVYDNNAFFPLDGRGWPGDDRGGHNFSFTTEIHTFFRYKGGERFTFTGDDDVFVFVNRKLALDLGGVHGRQSGTIDLDRQSAALGITPGQPFTLDIFHAERHTNSSNFRIETTIDCLIVSVD